MARYVEDLAPLLRIIAGPDNVDPAVVPMPLADPDEVDLSALRVAFYTNDGISDPTGETQTVVATAANALAGTGASVEEGRPDGLERAFGIGLRFYIGAATTVRANRIREAAGQATSGSASGNPLDPSALDRLFEDWYTVRHEMTSFFNEHDVILCPVSTSVAPLHGNTAVRDFSYSIAYNVTGWPAGVVRAHQLKAFRWECKSWQRPHVRTAYWPWRVSLSRSLAGLRRPPAFPDKESLGSV